MVYGKYQGNEAEGAGEVMTGGTGQGSERARARNQKMP